MSGSIAVVYCMMQQDRLESVKRNLERVLPFVDAAVVVDNGSTDGTREWLLTQEKVVPVLREWNDSFVEGRNAYLSAVDDLSKSSDGPVLIAVADDDELYSDALLSQLRKLAQWMWEDDLNVLRVRSKSVETDWSGAIHWEQMDEWHKPLLFIHEPGIRYRGIGRSEVHEDIVIPSGRRERLLGDAHQTLYYAHIKRHGEIWLRGIRNFFAGGGGPNLGDLNPLWQPFRELVRQESGVTTAAEFVKYLKAGQVSAPILEWFRAHRLLGTKFDDTPPMWPGWPDGTSEVREGFLAYHLYLHPRTMPVDLIEADREYLQYDVEARIIHGPHTPEWAVLQATA